ncbi:sulfite exporter TauE/SafE family protein [Candidatus Parcubacteria bacterium]|nr:sulfite exporter TauE/SafE family protein [Patescibacteria group bacterium]MBU4380960.1 sulfite exporter TauE/SafE family protein [Patescibacteria group bacterium]MCG2689373.1 sulfite exporter TauE/SafE family protein [Candidatus Parcubacteria bacterium]
MMLKKTKIQIENISSENDKALIETEIDVLEGVRNVNIDSKGGESWVEFDTNKISQEEIFGKIKELKFQIKKEVLESQPMRKEHAYFVQGMHCASCEVLIEKRLLALKGIKSVEAKADKGEVLLEYTEEKPSVDRLNGIFRKENYRFFDQPIKTMGGKKENDLFVIAGAALFFIVGFFIIKNSGFAGLVNVSSTSSLPTFFLLGLLAGVSSCAALVGGLILSMSKQWLEMYSERNSTMEKLQPHLMFNAGRIVSYALLGAVIGAIGSKLQISLTFTSVLIAVVSVMMVFLALQMLGVKAFRKFQFTMPKFITRHIADETKFQGKYKPFLMGALTFFLPCGFTITAQSLALISGSPLQGALIMLFFALGTLPALLAIGLSSVKFSQKPHLANKFLKVAGVLVLFFALYNINAQLNVLGFSSLSDIKFNSNQQSANGDEDGLPPIVNGKQVIKMDALSSGYKPNYFKVKVGVPVRWEIADEGTSGCTNAIISRGLFADEIPLTPGQVSVKEFTPEKPGKYKFSCWMGMVSGIIEVVDSKIAAKSSSAYAQSADFANTNDNDVIPSGAKGCGCGGGSGSCGAR